MRQGVNESFKFVNWSADVDTDSLSIVGNGSAHAIAMCEAPDGRPKSNALHHSADANMFRPFNSIMRHCDVVHDAHSSRSPAEVMLAYLWISRT